MGENPSGGRGIRVAIAARIALTRAVDVVALGRSARSDFVLHPRPSLSHPNLNTQKKTRAAQRRSFEEMPDGAALRHSRGQTPLVHGAQRRRREKSKSWRSASKASDPFGQARSRAPALGRPARSDLVLHQEPLDTRVVEAPTRAKRQTHAHSLPARGAVTVSVRRGQTPLMHSATSSMSPFNATGLHAPKASDPGMTEARHRLAPLRRIAALPRASFLSRRSRRGLW